jgi:acyl CoA:acetate/3-ketoacid CoA transferase beta subunit
MALRFLAGAMGIPFIPTNSSLGSDIVAKWGFSVSPKLLVVKNGFKPSGNEEVILLPAINPEVTILHVQKVDTEGNVRIEGLTFADVEQAKAARSLIVTTEEIVENTALRSQPQLNQIPSFFVDAVVKVPKGAHPTQCFNYYDVHTEFLYDLLKASRSDEGIATFLERHVFGVKDHDEYLERLDKRILHEISATPCMGYCATLDRRKETPANKKKPVSSLTYSSTELMAIVAAREIKDTDIVFCGTGLPIIAACAAKELYAPQSVLLFETGAIDPVIFDLPMFVADSRVMVGSAVNSGLIDALSILQNKKIGRRIVAILGAAQIDELGNLNSTSIGDYRRPKSRLAGSGGAADAASLAGKTIVFMKHEKRRFVKKLDYLTSPGWVKGEDGDSAGLRPGGVSKVITDRCVLGFREGDRKMVVSEYYPGVKLDEIIANTGFELDTSSAKETEPPSQEELEIIREKVDPQRLIVG